ncbi:hypothetical protein TrST_g3403 [Triparma strigata]|uniref:K Homology domain-containing protein n=1 Tax=Triparma strigata TaxID=1606541 RepID=A0A9W7C072_9STRA|nr:hypothetical protein TrST_g3403 [Triparma strigata]
MEGSPLTPSTPTAPAVSVPDRKVAVSVLDRHTANPDDGLSIKLLLTNNVSGLLIGKGGGTITSLQSTSGTRIKLSQAGGFFPGTDCRVCLITGPQAGLLNVMAFIFSLHPTPMMRLLLPSQSIGFIMGQRGEVVEKIRQMFDVRIKVSSKGPGVKNERVVHVEGGDVGGAVAMMIEKMVENPSLSNYSNMTTSYNKPYYSEAHVGMPGHYQTTPPPLHGSQNQLSTTPPSPQFWRGSSQGPPPQGHLAQQRQQQQQQQQQQHPQLSPHTTPLREGPGPSPPLDASGAQSYPPQQFLPPAAMPYNSMGYNPYSGQYASDYSSNFSGSYPPQYQGYADALSYGYAGSSGSPPGDPTQGNQTVMQMAVPNSVIGCILGRGGTTMLELQAVSGARIKVSQRGEYVPGTENRIVTISGSSEACQGASMLITSKIRNNRIPHSHGGGRGYASARSSGSSVSGGKRQSFDSPPPSQPNSSSEPSSSDPSPEVPTATKQKQSTHTSHTSQAHQHQHQLSVKQSTSTTDCDTSASPPVKDSSSTDLPNQNKSEKSDSTGNVWHSLG